MNIFYVDKHPVRAAEQMCDKHIVKMILESAQLLSTCHRVQDGTEYYDKTANGRKIKRWRHPNPNIEQCLEGSFNDKGALSKLKIISKILVKNDHLYYKHLILGKLKYKAKIWGSSKSDLQKSISFKPSKDAYYFLYKVEKKLKTNERLIQELKLLYDKGTNDIYWKCTVCKLNYNYWYSFCNSCNSFNSIQSIKINENSKVNKNNQLINSGSVL